MRVIKLDTNKIIVGIKTVGDDYILRDNEIESEVGETGQILQADGSFITPEPAPIAPRISLDDKVNQLQQDNLILMDALATSFEKILQLETKIDALGGTV